jgi:hypothetical protein
MMMLKDYKCPTHGYFESDTAACYVDNCEANVMRVHLRAPGVKSERSKRADKTAKQLAMDYKMTDIKTAREGENQAGYYTRNNEKPVEQPREARPGDVVKWGGLGNMNMSSIMRGGMFKPVINEPIGINIKEGGNLTGPKIKSYTADHENLKIKP